MTFNETWNAFRNLSPTDQGRFLDAARSLVKSNVHFLRTGALVYFKNSKTGATIEGTFVRMKQKYAEVLSTKNQYGMDTGDTVRWSVPPEQLRLRSE